MMSLLVWDEGSAFAPAALRRGRLRMAGLAEARAWASSARAKAGAEEGIRTPTLLRAPAPQAGASASSATSAMRDDQYCRPNWQVRLACGWLSRMPAPAD